MDFANGAPSPLDNVINRIYLQTTLRSHTFQFFVSIITSIFSVIDTILIGIGIDLPAAYRRMGYILGGIGGRLAGLVGAGPKGSKEDYELQSESGTDDGIVEGHSSALDATKGTRKLKMRRSVPAETEIIGESLPYRDPTIRRKLTNASLSDQVPTTLEWLIYPVLSAT